MLNKKLVSIIILLLALNQLYSLDKTINKFSKFYLYPLSKSGNQSNLNFHWHDKLVPLAKNYIITINDVNMVMITKNKITIILNEIGQNILIDYIKNNPDTDLCIIINDKYLFFGSSKYLYNAGTLEIALPDPSGDIAVPDNTIQRFQPPWNNELPMGSELK